MSNRVIPAGAINLNATIAPGVVVIESLAPGAISGIPTNIIGAVGVATWGPVNAPIQLSTPADYTNYFGAVLPIKYDLGTFVNAAYLQGTVANYACVRVTDGTDIAAGAFINDAQHLPGALFSALYSGTTGNTIQVAVSNGTAGLPGNSYNVSIGLPGYASENFNNIAAPCTVLSIAVTAGGSGYTSTPNVLISGGGGSGATATATISGGTVTAINVTTAGNNYVSPPTISIVGGGGSGATATATISSPSGAGFWNNLINAINMGQSGVRGPSQLVTATASTGIGGVTITNVGSGFTGAPTISFTGGGTGATATATVGFPIASVAVNTPGSYATLPSISVTGPGSGAVLTPVMKAVGATITSAGAGYAVNDILTVSGGTSSIAAVITVATVDGSGHILTANITTLGSYTALPTNPVSVTGGTGTGATFTMSWGLLSVTVATPGNGYTSASIIAVTGGGGTGGATGTITLSATGGVLSSIVVNTAGYNYVSPTVVITGGGGTGAAATAQVGGQNLPILTTYPFSGGTNGATGVTGTTLLGIDGANPSGMYALRNSGMSLFALVDCDDSTTYSSQNSFAQVTGSQAILVGPSGQRISDAITAKNNAGINSTSCVFLIGDWCYFLDTNNNGITRLISPQGFYGGLMGNLSPEQSPLNKPLNGILATQRTTQGIQYNDGDYVTMLQNGLEVISNPIPAGNVFGCETGKSASTTLTNSDVCIQRMANFIAYSLGRSGVLGAYIGQLQTPSVQDSARAALTTFFENLVINQQIEAYNIVLDGTNNPNSRVVLGFMQASVTVQLFSVIIVFIIDLNVGTVTIAQ